MDKEMLEELEYQYTTHLEKNEQGEKMTDEEFETVEEFIGTMNMTFHHLKKTKVELEKSKSIQEVMMCSLAKMDKSTDPLMRKEFRECLEKIKKIDQRILKDKE